MVIKEIPVRKDGKYILVIEFERGEDIENFVRYGEDEFRDELRKFFDSDTPVLVVPVVVGIELKLVDVTKVQETENENRDVIPESATI